MLRRLPLLFALVKFFSGLALAGYGLYELHRDEYLYLDYGRHLAWGYLEVPPLTALQSWLTLALGGGFFLVKMWPWLGGSAGAGHPQQIHHVLLRGGGRWRATAYGAAQLAAGGRWGARLVQAALLGLPVLLTVRLAPILFPVLPPAQMAALRKQPFYQKNRFLPRQ